MNLAALSSVSNSPAGTSSNVITHAHLLAITIRSMVARPSLRIILLEQIGIATREIRAAFVVNVVMVWLTHCPFQCLNPSALSILL